MWGGENKLKKAGGSAVLALVDGDYSVSKTPSYVRTFLYARLFGRDKKKSLPKWVPSTHWTPEGKSPVFL